MATFEQAIEAAVKAAVLRAHPIGSYFITESTDNPQEILGGGNGQKFRVDFSSAQVLLIQ